MADSETEWTPDTGIWSHCARVIQTETARAVSAMVAEIKYGVYTVKDKIHDNEYDDDGNKHLNQFLRLRRFLSALASRIISRQIPIRYPTNIPIIPPTMNRLIFILSDPPNRSPVSARKRCHANAYARVLPFQALIQVSAAVAVSVSAAVAVSILILALRRFPLFSLFAL